MTVQPRDRVESRCPKCGTPAADERQLEYGYCASCRSYTHVTGIVLDGDFIVPKMNSGGAMRCCTEPFVPWIMLHPGPWERGTVMPCLTRGTENDHGLVYDKGLWRSLFAVEAEKRDAAANKAGRRA